jgi:hypothetical protein
MNANQQLLAEIDAFLAVSGMAATTFGKKAAGNSQVVERMREGCSVTLRTADRIRQFIAENRPNREGRRRVA